MLVSYYCILICILYSRLCLGSKIKVASFDCVLSLV